MGGGKTSGTQNANGVVNFAPNSADGGSIMIGGSVANGPVTQQSSGSASGAGVDLKLDMPMPMPMQLQNLDQEELQNLITWKGAGELAKKAHGAGLFQNLEQDELQNLITWKGAGKLAGKAGKAYLTGGLFQNLEQ